MAKRATRLEPRSWIVRLSHCTFDAAQVFVTAATEEEAKKKAEACDWDDAPDVTISSIADFKVASVEENR